MASESVLRGERIIIEHRAPAGVLAGALGCVFGVLGIFFIGLIFVPLAALCAIIGLIRGIGSGSATAIGLSILAGILCFFGFAVSPSFWLLLGVGLLAGLMASHHATPTIAPPPVNPPAAYYAAPPSSAYVTPTKSFDDETTLTAGKLAVAVDQFDAVADRYHTEISSVDAKYQAITSRMDELLQRERDLVGDPNASVTRGQLSVAINQASIATDQLHNQVLSFELQVRDQVRPLWQSVWPVTQTCHRAASPDFKPGPEKTNCLALLSAADTFRRNLQDLKDGFAHAEQVFQREHETQADLVAASERIE